MANRHFAEIGDVWKHLPLAEILRIDSPRIYWESHAGSAVYALAPSEARDYGVGRFHRDCARQPQPELGRSRYAELLNRYSATNSYPGSPAIAMSILPDAQFTFCDTDPESIGTIRAEAERLGIPVARVRLEQADGVRTLADALERTSAADRARLFVHLDPYQPLERGDSEIHSVELFWRLARAGVEAMLWYGFDALSERIELLGAVRDGARRERIDSQARGLWCGEIFPEFLFRDGWERNSSFIGAGVLCCNLDARVVTHCARLGRALSAAYANAEVRGGSSGALTFQCGAGVPEPGVR